MAVKVQQIRFTTGHIPGTVVTIPKVHRYGRQYRMTVPYIRLIRSTVDSLRIEVVDGRLCNQPRQVEVDYVKVSPRILHVRVSLSPSQLLRQHVLWNPTCVRI